MEVNDLTPPPRRTEDLLVGQVLSIPLSRDFGLFINSRPPAQLERKARTGHLPTDLVLRCKFRIAAVPQCGALASRPIRWFTARELSLYRIHADRHSDEHPVRRVGLPADPGLLFALKSVWSGLRVALRLAGSRRALRQRGSKCWHLVRYRARSRSRRCRAARSGGHWRSVRPDTHGAEG